MSLFEKVQKGIEQQIYRVIDANFNRSKEGLRVLEDICRFLYDQKYFTKKYRNLRQQLTVIMAKCPLRDLIIARNIEGDVGGVLNQRELRRNNVTDVFYANSQRVKESVRVLEEFMKLINKRLSVQLKTIRYDVYSLEKKILGKITDLKIK